MMAEELVRAVRAFCREEGLLQPGQHVVCALSGGADSMALLCILQSMSPEITLSAAHFNHKLRGAESDRDEAFVRDFCAARGIPLITGRGDVAAYSARTGLGIEEAARELRYEFLDTLDCDCIATAHHADDNAETVLLHLLRGSGLRGLCGIPPRRGRIIRPLLTVPRAALRDYLRAHDIPWVEDSTNGEDTALRNRLRHHVMPELETLAPGLTGRLSSQSALLRRDDRCLDEAAADLLASVREADGSLRCAPLIAASPALECRALRLWLGEALPQNLSRTHVEALRALLRSPDPAARCSLPRGLTACRRYGSLDLVRETSGPFSPVRVSPGSRVVKVPELGLKFTCTPVEKSEKIPNSPFHFAIRCDMINGDGFIIRPRAPGDRMATPGGCHTSLKKLFIARRIPREQRGRVPVLDSGGRVLAVAGIGADFEVLPGAGQPALVILIEKEE